LTKGGHPSETSPSAIVQPTSLPNPQPRETSAGAGARSGKHGAEKLFNSILDPSASITLKMAGDLTKPVLRTEIASLKNADMSLMPEGLEVALTPQCLADLIAYLKVAR